MEARLLQETFRSQLTAVQLTALQNVRRVVDVFPVGYICQKTITVQSRTGGLEVASTSTSTLVLRKQLVSYFFCSEWDAHSVFLRHRSRWISAGGSIVVARNSGMYSLFILSSVLLTFFLFFCLPGLLFGCRDLSCTGGRSNLLRVPAQRSSPSSHVTVSVPAWRARRSTFSDFNPENYKLFSPNASLLSRNDPRSALGGEWSVPVSKRPLLTYETTATMMRWVFFSIASGFGRALIVMSAGGFIRTR